MEPVPLLILLGVTTGVLLSPLLHRRLLATLFRRRRSRAALAWTDAVSDLHLEEDPIRAPREVGRAHGRVDGVPVELVVSARAFGEGLRHELRAASEDDEPLTMVVRGFPTAETLEKDLRVLAHCVRSLPQGGHLSFDQPDGRLSLTC